MAFTAKDVQALREKTERFTYNSRTGSFSEGEECNGECQIGKLDQEQ